MIFTDEIVGHIMMKYCIPHASDKTKTYEWLQMSGQCFYFYSRLDDHYSDYAITTFGYPDDCVTKDTEETP